MGGRDGNARIVVAGRKDAPSMYTGPKRPVPIDFTSILVAGAGLGLFFGSFLGIGGAILGLVVGITFGYWAKKRAELPKIKFTKGPDIELSDVLRERER